MHSNKNNNKARLCRLYSACLWVITSLIAMVPVQAETTSPEAINPAPLMSAAENRREILTHLPSALIAGLALLFAVAEHRKAGRYRDQLTERSATQLALGNEKGLPYVAEYSNAGLWQVNREGRTVYMNPAMRALLQIDDLQELTSMNPLQYLVPVRKTGRASDQAFEAMLVGKQGRKHCVLISETPMLDDNGYYCGILRTVTDITERTGIRSRELVYEEGILETQIAPRYYAT